MPALDLASALRVDAPFPGLRPFEENEAHLFFGRETHVEELLERLSRRRFLAVVGASGSGKSSLIKAGMLPDLYRGYLLGATSRWRVAVMRPGRAPLDALARALASPHALGPDLSGTRRRDLSKTSHGLLDAVYAAALPESTALLLVVDQFEELFRVEGDRRRREPEDSLFVSLLLEAAQAFRAPVFVVLTMRSDFLGDCARFPGLPEALNRSQYLVPRLTRDQRQQAIERPLDLAQVEIDPGLVQLVLNEAGDEPDDLPVLQHVLMRTFEHWRGNGGHGPIRLENYDAVHRSTGALDAHAEELVSRVSGGPAVVEQLFRCLTTSQEGRTVRRPALLSRILAVTGAATTDAAQEVETAIRLFASPGNNLLVAPATLAADSVIDISHESLISRWGRLREWVEAEAKSAEWYRDLVRDVHRGAGLWQGADLARVEDLRKRCWSGAWAEQYAGGPSVPFEAVDVFIRESRTQADAESRRLRQEALEDEQRRARELQSALDLAKAQRRAGHWLAASGGLLLLFLLAVVWFLVRDRNREAAAKELNAQVAESSREISTLRDAQEALLREKADLVSGRNKATNDAERDRIAKELLALQAKFDASVKQGQLIEQRLAQAQNQSAQAAPDGSQSALLTQISDLQRELTVAQAQRSEALKSLEALSSGTQQDAGYWKSRATQLETDLRLQGRPPTFAVLPQHSYLPLGGPFGEILVLLGDVSKFTKTMEVYLVSGQDLSGKDHFRENQSLFRSLRERFAARTACPGTSKDGLIRCFVAEKDATSRSTQRLGSLPHEGITHDVVAVAWTLNAQGGTDVLTLAVFPTPARPMSAK